MTPANNEHTALTDPIAGNADTEPRQTWRRLLAGEQERVTGTTKLHTHTHTHTCTLSKTFNGRFYLRHGLAEVMFWLVFVCLSLCYLYNSKSYGLIFIGQRVDCGPSKKNWSNFGSDLEHILDILSYLQDSPHVDFFSLEAMTSSHCAYPRVSTRHSV